jgi:Mg-chelatase subunit ChlD
MLAVDISSSMNDFGKFAAAQDAVRAFVSAVDFSRHRVGLVLFNDSAFVAQTISEQPDRVISAMAAVSRGTGGTNIAHAIAMADGELALRARPTAVSIVVLMTDGQSSEEPANAAARTARARGTVLFAIGLGDDAAQDVLRRLASSPEYFYYAPGADGLSDVYARIAALIRTIVVTDVWLTDVQDPAAGYVPGSGWPVEPTTTGPLRWRTSYVAGVPTIFRYRVRVDQAGQMAPSDRLWVEYVDGDGARRRLDIQPATVDVFEPVIHTIHLPVTFRRRCMPVTQRADVVLALDTSSSMAGAKLEQARQAAKLFVRLLDLPGDQAAIVSYAQAATLVQPLTADLAALEQAVDGLTYTQGTRIDRGIQAGVGELLGPRHRAANRPVLVLMSDGIQLEEPETAHAWAEYAWARGIVVYTVALGGDADRPTLQALADHPSHAYFAPDTEDLRAIYAQVAGAVRCR